MEEVIKNTESSTFSDLASNIYASLGGDANVVSFDNCATRLRVEVENMDKVDQEKIIATGVLGIHVAGAQSIQVIIGMNVQFVADRVKKIRKNK